MQRRSVPLLVALFLAYPVVGQTAYLIKLKNGNEFVTGRYWQEGTQVMFDTYGGVFGVERAFVSRIEESTKAVNQAAAPASVQAKSPAQPAKDEKEPKKAPPPAEAKTGPAREADPILKEFDALKQKSRFVNAMSSSELREFLKELTGLRRKIQTSGRSNDYLGEFAAISDMADAAEALLRSKR